MEEITFNLLNDPWIPCEMLSGEYESLNMKDVLFNAQDIKEITSENPLVMISIYRLLLTILHRNFGPENKDKWISIYRAGKWDKEVLEAYFKKWHHKFEIFNEPENRFYQNDISKIVKKKTLITKLDYCISSGNNTSLFDHHWDSDITALPVENAVQLLVSYQNYSVSGLGGFLYQGDKKKGIIFLTLH